MGRIATLETTEGANNAMNMTKQELREAITAKLRHRRELMDQNYALRGDVSRERERNKFLLNVVANPLVDMILEDCADQIMKAVIEHAIKASRIVADQTMDGQDYDIGISIPSLHIRHRIASRDLKVGYADGVARERRFSRINVDTDGPRR